MEKIKGGRIQPALEVVFVNEKDEIEAVDFGDKDRGKEGLEGLLEETGVLDAKFDPRSILDRAGTKFLSII